MGKNEGAGPIPEQALARRRPLALSFSSCQDPERNAEISRQRLDPRDVVELDKPDLSRDEATALTNTSTWKAMTACSPAASPASGTSMSIRTAA